MAKDLFTGEVIGKDLFEERGIKVKTPTSLKSMLLQPISKTLTGKSIAERIDFNKLNPASRNLQAESDYLASKGKPMTTKDFFFRQLPAQTEETLVNLADLSPTDIGIMAATGGAGKIPIKGTTLGEIAKIIPVGKGFVKNVGELGRYTQTLKNIMPFSASEIVKESNISLLPKPVAKAVSNIGRGLKRYQLARKGSQFESIRQDLPPLQRVEALKSKMSEKPNILLKEEQDLLKQTLERISGKEEQVIGKAKSAIEQSKVKLKENLDILANKMEQKTGLLKKDIDIASQQSALTGKQQYPRLAVENSTAYGKDLDRIINIAKQEGKLPTQSVLQNIFDKTDDELAKAFIEEGAPFTRYNKIKSKWLGGISDEANPEAQALAKAMGLKKGQLKSAGIDWSRVDVGQSQFKPPDTNAPINLEELLRDIRSVSKAISAKGKGVERAFTDDDLAAIIFQKNIGGHMAQTYPEFAKLQKVYAPLIEQMKAGRKLLKPGAPYDLGTAPKVLVKPDIVEQRLITELEQGTPGFTKGLGEITQPIKKAQQKLAGTEKGYDIARQRIEQMSNSERTMLSDLLKLREDAFQLAKEKVSAKSLTKQLEIKKKLDTINQALNKRKEYTSKLVARAKITGKERKAIEGGGIHTEVGYSIRRAIQRLLFGGF